MSDCHVILWLPHVLISCPLFQPNTHPLESARSKVHILIIALWMGLMALLGSNTQWDSCSCGGIPCWAHLYLCSWMAKNTAWPLTGGYSTCWYWASWHINFLEKHQHHLYSGLTVIYSNSVAFSFHFWLDYNFIHIHIFDLSLELFGLCHLLVFCISFTWLCWYFCTHLHTSVGLVWAAGGNKDFEAEEPASSGLRQLQLHRLCQKCVWDPWSQRYL